MGGALFDARLIGSVGFVSVVEKLGVGREVVCQCRGGSGRDIFVRCVQRRCVIVSSIGVQSAARHACVGDLAAYRLRYPWR